MLYVHLCVDRVENYAERRKQMIQESKYLGGDMEHTHLVKGLDYALLDKVTDHSFISVYLPGWCLKGCCDWLRLHVCLSIHLCVWTPVCVCVFELGCGLVGGLCVCMDGCMCVCVCVTLTLPEVSYFILIIPGGKFRTSCLCQTTASVRAALPLASVLLRVSCWVIHLQGDTGGKYPAQTYFHIIPSVLNEFFLADFLILYQISEVFAN